MSGRGFKLNWRRYNTAMSKGSLSWQQMRGLSYTRRPAQKSCVHFSKRAGRDVPMDIEWAKDGDDNELYVVQSRPETVASRRKTGIFESYSLKRSGPVLLAGRAV